MNTLKKQVKNQKEKTVANKVYSAYPAGYAPYIDRWPQAEKTNK